MPKRQRPNRTLKPHQEKIAALVAEIDDALGSARAFAMALELMGLGMRALEDDYSGALVTVTEAVLRHLDSAKGGLHEHPRRGRRREPSRAKQPTKMDAHIGARLRRLRLARDMAQAELGRQLGVSFMQVQKYECGVNRVSATRLFQIARYSKCRSGASSEGLQSEY